jgi:hypothetical protein
VKHEIDDVTSSIVDRVNDVLTSVGDDVNKLVEAIDQIPVLGTLAEGALAPIRIMAYPASLAVAAARGQNLADFTEREFGRVKEGTITGARLAQNFGGFVPGIGTAIAEAGTIITGLADGHDLSQIAIDMGVAAIPGGPLIQAALRAGAAFTKALIAGQSPRDALNDAVRATVPEAYRAEYDAASDIAKGKPLDLVGLNLVVDNLPGSAELHNIAKALILAAHDLIAGANPFAVVNDVVGGLPIPAQIKGGVATAMTFIQNAKNIGLGAPIQFHPSVLHAGNLAINAAKNQLDTAKGQLEAAGNQAAAVALQELKRQLQAAGIPGPVVNDLVAIAPSLKNGSVQANDLFKLAQDIVSGTGHPEYRDIIQIAATIYTGHLPRDIAQQVLSTIAANSPDAAKAIAIAQTVQKTADSAEAAQKTIASYLQAPIGAPPVTGAAQQALVEGSYLAGAGLMVAHDIQKQAGRNLQALLVDSPAEVRQIAHQIQFNPDINKLTPSEAAKVLKTPYEPTRRALARVAMAASQAKGIADEPMKMTSVLMRVNGRSDPEFNAAEKARYDAIEAHFSQKRLAPPMTTFGKVAATLVVASSVAVSGMAIYSLANRQTFETTAKQALGKTRRIARLR